MLRKCEKKLRKIQREQEKQQKTLLKCQRSQMSFKGKSGGCRRRCGAYQRLDCKRNKDFRKRIGGCGMLKKSGCGSGLFKCNIVKGVQIQRISQSNIGQISQRSNIGQISQSNTINQHKPVLNHQPVFDQHRDHGRDHADHGRDHRDHERTTEIIPEEEYEEVTEIVTTETTTDESGNTVTVTTVTDEDGNVISEETTKTDEEGNVISKTTAP